MHAVFGSEEYQLCYRDAGKQSFFAHFCYVLIVEHVSLVIFASVVVENLCHSQRE